MAPRPVGGFGIRHEIGAATLVTGQRVINCWEIWSGGFNIVGRHAVDDPSDVRHAAEWAVEHRAVWKDSGFPVGSVEDIVRTFIY